MIEPARDVRTQYFDEIPDAFKIKASQLLIVPSYHIFGSEQLSSQSPSVRELIAMPYIAVNPKQATDLNVKEDGTMEVAFSNISYHLPVKISSSVPEGLALVPKGLDGLQWDGLPFWFTIKPRLQGGSKPDDP